MCTPVFFKQGDNEWKSSASSLQGFRWILVGCWPFKNWNCIRSRPRLVIGNNLHVYWTYFVIIMNVTFMSKCIRSHGLLIWLYATVPIYESSHEVPPADIIVAKGSISMKRLKNTGVYFRMLNLGGSKSKPDSLVRSAVMLHNQADHKIFSAACCTTSQTCRNGGQQLQPCPNFFFVPKI